WKLAIRGSENELAVSLAKWSLEHARERPEIGPGKYLDAGALRSAVAVSECPIPVHSPLFSLNIVLFAALLPVEESSELISAAISLGATRLEVLISAELATSAEEDQKSEAPLSSPRAASPPKLDNAPNDWAVPIQQPVEMEELKEYLLLQESDQKLETD